MNASYFLAIAFSAISIVSYSQLNELKVASDKGERIVRQQDNETKIRRDYTEFVNPFVGTGGHGHTYPGASFPFGMMQLSPDTRFEGWDGCSGYHYSDSVIYGFSHTHLSGTGVPDYGDLLIVPQCRKKPKLIPGYLDASKGYGHPFSHDTEKASPGYYEVLLPEEKIKVRLTTTNRAGLHEYSFENTNENKFILIDLDHRDKLLAKSIELLNNTEIRGSRVSMAWAQEQHFYFHMVLSIPYTKAKLITDKGTYKLLLQFPKTTEKVMIRVGMSGTDCEGAKNNLNLEMPDFQFNKYHLAAKKAWNEELGKIDFRSRDLETMRIFYTALYHTCLQPNTWNDADGRYRGRDNVVHDLEPGKSQFTVFSLWDTFRATHPLYTLIQENRTKDFIETFMRQYKEGGDLPVWELAANETECMIGYNSVSVMADAFVKGIVNEGAKEALDAMVATSNFDELGKSQFRKNGFISSGDEPESVSKTLEYAYDDFCIAEMAKLQGNIKVYEEYYKRSLNFINIYDPSTKFMRARKGGLWHVPFDPSEVNFNYTEANSWQYSLFAPHAISVLAELMGGIDSLELWMDELFSAEAELSGRHQVDITGLIGQYAHGNEPSHHMAYLYNYTNAAHKTQFYVDKIQKEMYSDQPDGLSGNEDCGQMSAWYVLSALGLYQVTPGYAWYDFGRPLLDEAIVKFENGNTLYFKVINAGEENKYIEKITINGTEWQMNQIHHSTLLSGGEIVYYMTDKLPSNQRSVNRSSLDVSEIVKRNFTPSPFFKNKETLFENGLKIELGYHPPLNQETVILEYRFGRDTSKVYTYSDPFVIDQSETIEIRRTNVITYGGNNTMPGVYTSSSSWVKGNFVQIDNSVHLDLKTSYSPQYAAAGPNTLIDKIEGANEFRTGDYQGFWATDVHAVIQFDEPKELSEVGISALQDMKSWVFYPSEFIVELSYDGVKFENAGKTTDFPTYNDYIGPSNLNKYVTVAPKDKVKAIRVTVKNFGKCPEWHLGNGNDTWLFLDEILYR